MITFFIPGNPVPKGRPRFARVGKFVKTYSPIKTKSYEEIVAQHGRIAMGDRKPLDGALVVSIEFMMPIPKATPKKLRAAFLAGCIGHTKKPDLDNLQKGIFDGLNGICWVDDSQIDEITAKKRYSAEPGVLVKIFHN